MWLIIALACARAIGRLVPANQKNKIPIKTLHEHLIGVKMEHSHTIEHQKIFELALPEQPNHALLQLPGLIQIVSMHPQP